LRLSILGADLSRVTSLLRITSFVAHRSGQNFKLRGRQQLHELSSRSVHFRHWHSELHFVPRREVCHFDGGNILVGLHQLRRWKLCRLSGFLDLRELCDRLVSVNVGLNKLLRLCRWPIRRCRRIKLVYVVLSWGVPKCFWGSDVRDMPRGHLHCRNGQH
jgi:hypothetical protein